MKKKRKKKREIGEKEKLEVRSDQRAASSQQASGIDQRSETQFTATSNSRCKINEARSEMNLDDRARSRVVYPNH